MKELKQSQDFDIETSMLSSFNISDDKRNNFDKTQDLKNNKNVSSFDWYKLNDDTIKFQQVYEENEVVSILIFMFNFSILFLQPPPGMDLFMTEKINETGQFMYKYQKMNQEQIKLDQERKRKEELLKKGKKITRKVTMVCTDHHQDSSKNLLDA